MYYICLHIGISAQTILVIVGNVIFNMETKNLNFIIAVIHRYLHTHTYINTYLQYECVLTVARPNFCYYRRHWHTFYYYFLSLIFMLYAAMRTCK